MQQTYSVFTLQKTEVLNESDFIPFSGADISSPHGSVEVPALKQLLSRYSGYAYYDKLCLTCFLSINKSLQMKEEAFEQVCKGCRAAQLFSYSYLAREIRVKTMEWNASP